VAFSALGSTIGLWLSYQFEWPSGPAIVLTLGGVYLLSVFVGPRGAVRSRRVPAHHLKA
jgi:zinc/manganese transport system permease protein